MHTLMNYKGTHHYNYFSHQRQNFTPSPCELILINEVLFGSWHPFWICPYPSFNTGVFSQIEKNKSALKQLNVFCKETTWLFFALKKTEIGEYIVN